MEDKPFLVNSFHQICVNYRLGGEICVKITTVSPLSSSKRIILLMQCELKVLTPLVDLNNITIKQDISITCSVIMELRNAGKL